LSTYRHQLAESINELVTDPERAKRFGAAGRTRAEQEFSWSTMAAQTVEVYRSVI
jgi:starch synthase